jgi:hypothetical protein
LECHSHPFLLDAEMLRYSGPSEQQVLGELPLCSPALHTIRAASTLSRNPGSASMEQEGHADGGRNQVNVL